jgi:hypothetical protein
MVFVVTLHRPERNRPPKINWGYDENGRKYICSLGGFGGMTS